MVQNRRHDIDWLRICGILLLFPFHTARVFDHWDPFYVKNETLSWGASWFITIANLWFMPLLFWLAGSASWYALRVKSTTVYIKERFTRLFIPLLMGILLIVPPQGYYAIWDHTGKSPGSYIAFLKIFFTDFTDLSGYYGTFTPAHLWFILYLFVLSITALPIFHFFKNHPKTDSFNSFLSKPLLFILLFIVLTLSHLLPAPGGQNPFYFFVLFVTGFISCSDPRYQDMFNRVRFKLLGCMLIFVPVWILLAWRYPHVDNISSIAILLTVLRTFNVWVGLIVILGYGHKFLNFQHKWLPYLNEAAFPVYIIHQTVLVILGYYVIRLDLSIHYKYLLIMFATLTISLVIYDLIIKRTIITQFLFGVKAKKTNLDRVHSKNKSF
ncbi:acyltransferase family protein [Neobacillus vireti]|uniref:acyltransferase family protein n=1 Tax=Neobacillus vireti TaxID=220686 RepID=UPI0030003449